MSPSNPNINDNGNLIPTPASKLKHPTAYHIQRSKYKEMDFASSPMFLPPQQPPSTNDSPRLSEIDYADMPLHSDYMPYSDVPEPRLQTPTQPAPYYHSQQHRRSMDQGYIYDEQSIDSAFAFSNPEQMRKGESSDGGLARLAQPVSSNQDFMFYPHPSTLDHRFKQFAVSAPVNITYSKQNNHECDPEEGIMMMGPEDTASYSTHSRSEPRSQETYEDDYAAQINLQAMMDKRRRRRESHNAVERRRRDNINDRIQELGTLLPDYSDDGINRLNKGVILKKSVELIQKLQQDLMYYQKRQTELESLLKQTQTPPRH